jgi:hypothetical protein
VQQLCYIFYFNNTIISFGNIACSFKFLNSKTLKVKTIKST